jgi:metal-responsive CopG/Arc/MetJ family transcriptional regulator
MKVETSVTLPGELLEKIDRMNPDRSAFLGQAARMYLYAVAKQVATAKMQRSSTGTSEPRGR